MIEKISLKMGDAGEYI
jgi:hypothetical protein